MGLLATLIVLASAVWTKWRCLIMHTARSCAVRPSFPLARRHSQFRNKLASRLILVKVTHRPFATIHLGSNTVCIPSSARSLSTTFSLTGRPSFFLSLSLSHARVLFTPPPTAPPSLCLSAPLITQKRLHGFRESSAKEVYVRPGDGPLTSSPQTQSLTIDCP